MKFLAQVHAPATLLAPYRGWQASAGVSSDEPLEPGLLRRALEAAGGVSGEFGEDSAMVLAGRVVELLALAAPSRVPSRPEGERLALCLLVALGFPGAAAKFGSWEQPVEGAELLVVGRDHRVVPFEPARLMRSLARRGALEHGEVMVVAGTVIGVLLGAGRRLWSGEALARLAADAALAHGFEAAARRLAPVAAAEAEVDLRGWLRRLESALRAVA